MIETRPITIEVDAGVAQAYGKTSRTQRRKLDILLSLKLSEVIRSKRTLEEIMREISQNAQARGLTQDKLEQLLQDE